MDYIPNNTIALNFIKKEPVTGSYKGMRYRLMKSGDQIEVCIWPEPYNFIKTKEEHKQYNSFPLTEEGKDAAVEWLNRQVDEQSALWKLALSTSWV